MIFMFYYIFKFDRDADTILYTYYRNIHMKVWCSFDEIWQQMQSLSGCVSVTEPEQQLSLILFVTDASAAFGF